MDSTFASISFVLLPILISLIALLHSTGIITKFKLEIYLDGYLLPKSSDPNAVLDSFPIVLPLIFNNIGDHSGVIKDVILKVTNTKTYPPNFFFS